MKDILERLEQKMDAGFAQVDRQLEEGRERDRGFERSFSAIEAQLQKQGVLLEDLRGDTKMALEGIIGNREATNKGFADVLRKLDERVQPIELASRHFGRELRTPAKGTGKRRRR
jgi:hypothetical protein